MAAITNPETIRSMNEELRPLCEKLRALKAEIVVFKTKWDGGIGAIIGLSAQDTLEDGREAEGISRLNAFQIVQAVEQLSIVTTINSEIIQKPCVNPLRVQ